MPPPVENQCLSTWALARSVAIELSRSVLVQNRVRRLFGRPLAVWLGALGPAKTVRMPYALVAPAEESDGRDGLDHVISVTVGIDAGEDSNTAEARPLEESPGVLVVGCGDRLQEVVDAIRDHFEEALPGSVQTAFDVEFDGFSAYPAQTARISIQFHDELAF